MSVLHETFLLLNVTILQNYKKGRRTMPDITMCRTRDCPKKECCYRYKAKPDEVWQSWSDFTEPCREHGYEHRIPLEK